jgi:hypothetical protein
MNKGYRLFRQLRCQESGIKVDLHSGSLDREARGNSCGYNDLTKYAARC